MDATLPRSEAIVTEGVETLSEDGVLPLNLNKNNQVSLRKE